MLQDLELIKKLVYTPCGLIISDFKTETESKAYGACSYRLGEKNIIHRFSKITPTKPGQFVTLWKRDAQSISIPFDYTDPFDFVIITARKGNHFGQFLFPKAVLTEKGIVTHNHKTGKRGFRVYPSWDVVTSKQALQTQNWQVPYFYPISEITEKNRSWKTKGMMEIQCS